MGDRERIEFGVRLDCLFTLHRKKKMAVADKLGFASNTLTNWLYGRKLPSVERFMELCNEIGATDEEVLHCLLAFRNR